LFLVNLPATFGAHLIEPGKQLQLRDGGNLQLCWCTPAVIFHNQNNQISSVDTIAYKEAADLP
jgi:hypothetical protein